MTEAPAAGPLDGLVVIEAGQLIAGPFCGQLLGDFGATVIKIEPPGSGDPMREWGQGAQVWWEVIARNKKSVSIDLRRPEGQALAKQLILGADVLVENFRPGTLESWGLDPQALRAENPRLIVARMSGYGQTGPYANRPGYGGAGEAMGGWRVLVGDPDRPASRMGVSIGDSLAATYGCLGVLAALLARTRNGRGQTIDCALYEAVLQVMEGLVPEYVVSGKARERSGSILPGIAPSNVYRCQDGDYLIAGNGDSIFRRLAAAIGRPKLAEDPRFATHRARGARQQELDAIIEAWTSTRVVADVEAAMIENGVPASRLYRPADMLEDPHFAAREALVTLPDHPRWPGIVMQNVVPRLSETPGAVRSIAPQKVGQDNSDVLCGRLGLSTEQLEELKRQGVI
jgi:crotonobetainyl-CoA:carnitine CoA-transferase CaiB-like acyl-CoA transferase